MKFTKYVACILVVLMLVSTFVACGGNSNTEGTTSSVSSENVVESSDAESATSKETEATSKTEATSETEVTSEIEATSEIKATSETEVTSETETTSETEVTSETEAIYETEATSETEATTESETVTTIPRPEIVENASSLANGVSAHYSDGSRKDYYVNNQNMTVHLGLGGDGNKAVRSITNKKGGVYIENTMDVYAIVSGERYTFSNSNVKARANIYRLGYYFYDVHVLDQSLFDATAITARTDIEVSEENIFEQYDIAPVFSNGEVIYKVKSVRDPNIAFKTNYVAAEYNCISFKMKANAASIGNIYVCAGGDRLFSGSRVMSFDIINDGEYHTYVIDLASAIKDYTGTVTGIRFDVGHSEGETIGIKDIQAVKVNTDVPELYLDRTLNTYSDKLHQVIHVVAKENVTNIEALGMITRIDASTVAKVIVKDKNGISDSIEGVDWSSAEYIGFDVKDAGVFGYILPEHKESGSFSVTLENGYYVIDQVSAPEGNKLDAKAGFNMGNRIYTDENHSFDAFVKEAEYERNPIETIRVTDGSGSSKYVGYDHLRGAYRFEIAGTDFSTAYYKTPDHHFSVSVMIDGIAEDRSIYIYTHTLSQGLEGSAMLDLNNMLLPINVEVCKNFCGEDEEPLFDDGDVGYGEAIVPIYIRGGEELEFTILNLYQNWGNYPLKQLSAIQYYAPYYHLSTGVSETNCISPYYGRTKTLYTLPDHRAMSAPLWESQPQHTAGGHHIFLKYVDKYGVYSASETREHTINSSGLTYVDLSMGYMSDDGRIKATYQHIEMPQTDENRTYYIMTYEVLEDIEFDSFKEDFQFYSMQGYVPYKNLSYLDANNEFKVTKNSPNKAKYYSLGTEAPYFALYGADHNDYINLSCIIADWDIVIGGEKFDGNLAIKNADSICSLTLNIEEVTLKAGDTMKICMILTPWGYTDSTDDTLVRNIRENTCLDPIAVTSETDKVIDNMFMPEVRSADGESAIFTLSGGPDRVAVRVYGFDAIGVPKLYEQIKGKWRQVKIASDNRYDGYWVYLDEDGTLSYSFVIDREDGAETSFKVAVEEPEYMKHNLSVGYEPSGKGDGKIVKKCVDCGEVFIKKECGHVNGEIYEDEGSGKLFVNCPDCESNVEYGCKHEDVYYSWVEGEAKENVTCTKCGHNEVIDARMIVFFQTCYNLGASNSQYYEGKELQTVDFGGMPTHTANHGLVSGQWAYVSGGIKELAFSVDGGNNWYKVHNVVESAIASENYYNTIAAKIPTFANDYEKNIIMGVAGAVRLDTRTGNGYSLEVDQARAIAYAIIEGYLPEDVTTFTLTLGAVPRDNDSAVVPLVNCINVAVQESEKAVIADVLSSVSCLHRNVTINEKCEQICTKCGEKASDELIHTPSDEWTEASDGSGLLVIKCTVCDAVLETNACKHTNATYSWVEGEAKENKLCIDCGHSEIVDARFIVSFDSCYNNGATNASILNGTSIVTSDYAGKPTHIAYHGLVSNGWCYVSGGVKEYVFSVDGGKTWYKVSNVYGSSVGSQDHYNAIVRAIPSFATEEDKEIILNLAGAIKFSTRTGNGYGLEVNQAQAVAKAVEDGYIASTTSTFTIILGAVPIENDTAIVPVVQFINVKLP